MTADHDLDRRLDDFLLDGPTELPVESFDAVRDRTEQTRQRVVIGPWRLPDMNKLVPLGLGAAAVVVAFVVGAQFLGPSAPPGVGGVPSPSPSPTPVPSPSPSPDTPPLTQDFTSQMHGISLSYPEGWIARAATEPWTDRPGVAQFVDPGLDVLRDPVLEDHLFLDINSQPIGDSTPEDWVAATLAGSGCTTTEPITVDGATGLIGADDCHIVAVTTAGRGYRIELVRSSDDPEAVASYDRAWFEEVLATVQLQPEDAVDGPPQLTQSFTSQMHGISLSYPEGWTVLAATEPWTNCLYCSPVRSAPYVDVLLHPVHDDGLFLRIASEPIGESAPEDWAAAQMADDDRCTTTERIIVDGATGLSGGETCLVAVVTTAGRGYHIDLWMSPDDLDLVAQYDRAWFEEILATVQLRPEDAVDGPPPLTQSFTSTQHGISLSYPEGWIARAATEPWTDRPGVPQFDHPGYDVLYDPVPDSNLFLWITSKPIGDSTPEDWVAATIAAWECPATGPIAVDGATGLISDACPIVVVTTDGRGYEIGLYTPLTGERQPFPNYGRAWFEEVLATVQLQPEDAVDAAPSASP